VTRLDLRSVKTVGIHDGPAWLAREHFRLRAGGNTACRFPEATRQERYEVGSVSSNRKSSGKKRRETARTIGKSTRVLIEALPDDARLAALKEKLLQVHAVARLLSLPDVKAASQVPPRRGKKRGAVEKPEKDPCAKGGP
jgi:hypothetical protein